ncbi:hypothetical protein DPMN_132108 [Dreissena polymorpha]|uniref:Uncharacterized protein n=1 Tax=Dreissena polymorpha TaxID=45954 RepID=A0A9D4J9T0_DREPO|nr:hypothetical protein DPMN_132108 [Dreissena polymorpha]
MKPNNHILSVQDLPTVSDLAPVLNQPIIIDLLVLDIPPILDLPPVQFLPVQAPVIDHPPVQQPTKLPSFRCFSVIVWAPITAVWCSPLSEAFRLRVLSYPVNTT